MEKKLNLENVFRVGELQPKYVRFVDVDVQLQKMTSSDVTARLLRNFYCPDQIGYREMFFCVYLNRSNHVIGIQKVSEGGVAGTVVDPKLIFSQALLIGACGIVLSHNHPSGNLKPSQQDLSITRKIKAGCEFLDIQLLDHVIMTETSFMSFAEEGLL